MFTLNDGRTARGTAGADKAAVRARLLAARRRLAPEVCAAVATRLHEVLREVLADTGARTVAGYIPFGSEPGGPDLPAVLAGALPPGGRLLLPVLRDDRGLDWALYEPNRPPAGVPPDDPDPALHQPDPQPAGGPAGDSPAGDSPAGGTGRAGGSRAPVPAGRRLGVAAIGAAELVVAPALAVDRRGVRLGRGGGSYDRALALVPAGAPVVALLYDGELLGPGEHLPAEPHDRPVSAAITPTLGLVGLPTV